jgi:hypothetical protein
MVFSSPSRKIPALYPDWATIASFQHLPNSLFTDQPTGLTLYGLDSECVVKQTAKRLHKFPGISAIRDMFNSIIYTAPKIYMLITAHSYIKEDEMNRTCSTQKEANASTTLLVKQLSERESSRDTASVRSYYCNG